MKKSLLAASVALAAVLTLAGCSGHGSDAPSTTPSPAATSTPITTWTQIHDLTSAITWALQITPTTPNVDDEITHTGVQLKKYVDASSAYSDANRKKLDAQLTQLAGDITAGKSTDYIGGELAAAAQNALEYLNKK